MYHIYIRCVMYASVIFTFQKVNALKIWHLVLTLWVNVFIPQQNYKVHHGDVQCVLSDGLILQLRLFNGNMNPKNL